MREKSNKSYPVIRQGAAGYWHAYGDGWAVCAPTKSAVIQRYEDMAKFMSELIARPLPKEGDILRP